MDGEIVALRDGRTDFSLLQRRMQLTDPRAALARGVPVVYFLFDLLRLDGCDTTRLPLRTRKTLLRGAIEFRGPLRFTPHRNHGGQDLLDQARARGWEGLIAKRPDSVYVARRSSDWLKLKCVAGQEFVIGGFTEPSGSRAGCVRRVPVSRAPPRTGNATAPWRSWAMRRPSSRRPPTVRRRPGRRLSEPLLTEARARRGASSSFCGENAMNCPPWGDGRLHDDGGEVMSSA